MGQSSLLSNPKFWPLFYTQLFGAFNDNFFKNGLIILITYQSMKIGSLDPPTLVALCGAIFIFPFFLFSATAGQLADKYEKSKMIVYIKVLEIFIMLLATVGFITGSIQVLMVTLFLMGTQSAFFGPLKYSYFPQILPDNELVGVNALLQTGTFLAILLGTLAGGIIIAIPGNGPIYISIGVILLAFIGFFFSRAIPSIEVKDPSLRVEYNPIFPTWRIIRYILQDRTIALATFGTSWFWFYGAAMLSLFPGYAKTTLGGNEHVATLLLALFSVGIGLGCMICKKISGRNLELGLVPIGSIGLTIFIFDLFLIPYSDYSGMAPLTLMEFLNAPNSFRVIFDLTMVSFSGGFFIVPMMTLIQQKASKAHLSRVIAAGNIINALFMVVAAVMLTILFKYNFASTEIFVVLAVLNLFVAIYVYTVLPEFFLRFVGWILTKLIYRLRPMGLEHIPHKGPALLVCNHVTYVDWLFLTGAIHRPIRFIMNCRFLEVPVAGSLLKMGKVIPIAPAKVNPEILSAAWETVHEALQDGNLVCIFPEGVLTKDGKIAHFRPGIEKIIQRDPVPVIPMALCGVWQSYFSTQKGNLLQRFPGKLWKKVKLRISSPLDPQQATSQKLHEIITALVDEK